MWTCEHRLGLGGQTDLQVDASLTQVARKPFQYSLARAPEQRKTVLKQTCVDVRWVAKRLKTCVRMHANLSCIKVDVSHRMVSQVHASRGETESQVTTSSQLAITCDSIWPEHFLLPGRYWRYSTLTSTASQPMHDTATHGSYSPHYA